VRGAPSFCARLEAEGVLAGPTDSEHVRFVTHLDVDDRGIDVALAAARRAATV
jgi:threonine aldolase